MFRITLNLLKWLSVLAVVFGMAFVVYLFVKIHQPLTFTGQARIFTVPAGVTTKQVARSLAEERFISRALFFEFYVYYRKAGGKIQAGRYELAGSMSPARIADKLMAGETLSDAVRMTVIEGWTVADIGEALEAKGIVKKIEFVRENASAEGYLFPDTYLVARGATSAEIAKKMTDNFRKKAGEVSRRQLILASIVEREVGRNVQAGEKLSAAELAKLQEERRLVAGVFENRLALGMALQSDATVAYVTGSRSDRATLEELQIKSPYNTYLHQGLPPGPISNPGLLAIQAAQDPAQSDYLYFVTAADGTAYFAKTLREHEINKNEHLRLP